MVIAVPKLPNPPKSQVTWQVQVTAELNITAFAARQKVNRYLIMHVGDMLYAGEPELLVADVVRWRVPVLFATRAKGPLGTVGELLVDVTNGQVIVDDPKRLEEIAEHAEALYRRAASSTRT